MKTKSKVLIIIPAVLLAAIIILHIILKSNQNRYETSIDLTSEEKIEDFEYLCTILNESYPFWNEVKDQGIDKEEIFNQYKDGIISADTDIQFMKSINNFLGEFNGLGHLSVLDGFFYHYYNEILSMAETRLPVSELEMMQPLYDVLNNRGSKEVYSFLNSSHRGFRNQLGLKEKYRHKEADLSATEDTSDNLVLKSIDNGNTAYIKIHSFGFENIETDRLLLKDFYNQTADYKHLIIDIQDNSGGSDSYWEELIVALNIQEPISSERYFLFNKTGQTASFEESYFRKSDIFDISSLPEMEKLDLSVKSRFSSFVVDTSTIEPLSESRFQGDIWVLINGRVYSASENFSVFCKNTGFATLVGTPTAGDGGFDPILIALPNSGLIVRFSMLYGLNNDGSGNEAFGTEPDIEAGESENPLEVCLSQIDLMAKRDG